MSDVSFLYYIKDASSNSDDFIKRYAEMSNIMRKHIGAPIPTFNMPNGEIVSKGKTCMAGDIIFHIAVNGEVTTCPFTFNSCGNVLNDDMETIIRNLKSDKHVCAYRKTLVYQNKRQ